MGKQLTNRTLALLGGVALLLASCRKDDTPTPAPQDDRGRLMTTLIFNSLLDWSVDGRELYYWTYSQVATAYEGNYQLYALNVQTGERRTIYNLPMVVSSTSAYWSRSNVQSPDGEYLYLAARRRRGQEAGFTLYRVSTRQLNQAVAIDSSYDKSAPAWGLPYSPALLLSPDGTRLVYQHRADSVRIHNLITKTAVAVPAEYAVDFSPDGNRVLLYRSGGVNRGYRDVSLTDFSEKPLALSIPQSQFPYANSISGYEAKWLTEGVCAAYTNQVPGVLGLSLWNATTQTSRLLRKKPDDEFGNPTSVFWSRDGRRIFYWSSNNPYTRDTFRQYLYTTELSTLKTDKLATYIGREGESASISNFPPMLTYDNAQLVYTVGNKLYAVSIPH